MKEELDQTCKALAKKQLDLDMIKVRISSLERKKRIEGEIELLLYLHLPIGMQRIEIILQ
jgi:hypothetical protein